MPVGTRHVRIHELDLTNLPAQPREERLLFDSQRHRVRRTTAETGEAFGYFHTTGSEFRFHHFEKFRRMCGLEDNCRIAGMCRPPFPRGQPANGTMGIDLILIQRLHFANRRTGPVVVK